jgi:hypothetical protein
VSPAATNALYTALFAAAPESGCTLAKISFAGTSAVANASAIRRRAIDSTKSTSSTPL